MSLPEVWKNADIETLTVVDAKETISYNLVERDTGEDRMPEMINSRYMKYGATGIGYYSGFEKLVQKDSENENRVPVVFRRGGYVEVVYGNRTEVYKEDCVYPVGSNGRIYEELSRRDYEDYYRNNGFRQVAS